MAIAGKVSPLVRSLLREQYSLVDSKIPNIINLLTDRGADECWHKHSTFKQHLISVWKIMSLWNQRPEAARAGLCHSAYSNSYVNLKIFNADDELERATVREAMGDEAEKMILLWCTINRRAEVVDRLLSMSPKDLSIELENGLIVKHLRTGEDIKLSAQQVGELLVFEMADACDQQFGWQDELMGGEFYQDLGNSSQKPWQLWPGESKPGLWMSTMSQMGLLVSTCAQKTYSSSSSIPNLSLPPVFNHCQSIIEPKEEIKARDLYWDVVSQGGFKTCDPASKDAIRTLYQASELNPFIAEPHAVRAQIQLDAGDYPNALASAEEALKLFCAWGTPWDKRMGWAAWVAWSRLLAQRAQAQEGWPKDTWGVMNLGLVHQP